MTYSHTGLNQARRRLDRLRRNLSSFLEVQAASQAEKASASLTRYESAFKRFMNDDFYTPGALAVLEQFASQLRRMGGKVDERSKMKLEEGFRKMANVLGILS